MPAIFSGYNGLKKYILCLLLLIISAGSVAQKTKADSLSSLLAKEKTDTNRVRLLWQLGSQLNVFNPDTAIHIAQQALYLAKKIKYEEGESRSLGVLSNSFIKIGNYPRALELNIEKLQLEEKRQIPRNMASVLMNIGVIYVLQKEYTKALNYYQQSETVINLRNVESLKYYIDVNLGDIYNRLDISDTAYYYFNRSLQLAIQLDDIDLKGTSLAGLGHSYLKLGKTDSSKWAYYEAINYLRAANDDEMLCEATLGLANLFKKTKQFDSSKTYAVQSYVMAKADGFMSKELEAAQFLTDHFRTVDNIDSAFAYINIVQALNDSVNSNNRVRESQIISSNEQFRQSEIEETNRVAKEERKQRLQLLFIGIFIPGFFLFTLFLSRVRVHIKVIRVLGILSLLFFFEYITILLHPAVATLTHHTPWIEILIFVAIGAILVPAHHRLEHWLIQKLMSYRLSIAQALVVTPEGIVVEETTSVSVVEDDGEPEVSDEVILNEAPATTDETLPGIIEQTDELPTEEKNG
jgi:tetratricopeptide (TPR) repeat protein